MVNFLFNSEGRHIANEVDGQLHSPKGKNIGHTLDDCGIFIDMRGKYLGEVIYNDRLMYNRQSPYKSTNFGNYGNYGNAGNYGNPGHAGNIDTASGFMDIPAERLKG